MPGSSNDNHAPYVDRIDINDPADLRRWAETFNVSEEVLRQVVAATGFMLDDIREELADETRYFLSATNTPSQSAGGRSARYFRLRSM